MPVGYKLRLSDGTLLVVDHEGLSTWLVDDKAMVQLVGSSHWRPLKAFLAGERAAARRAARERPNAAAVLPLIPPPPRKEETPRPAEPPPRDPVDALLDALPIVEPTGVPLPAEPAASRGTPREAKAEARPPTPSPPRAEAAPRRQAEPLPSDPVEPLSLAEPPAVQIRSDEPVDPPPESLWSSPAPEEEAPIPRMPIEDDVPHRPAASPWSEPVEPPTIGAPRSLLVLADDLAPTHSAGAEQTPVSDDPHPIIRLKPLDDRDETRDATEPSFEEARDAEVVAAPPWRDPRDAELFRVIATVGGFLSVWLRRLDRLLGRLSSAWREASAPRSRASAPPEAPVRAPATLQVLAEEPTNAPDAFSRGRSTADQELPIVPPRPSGKGQAPHDPRATSPNLRDRATEWLGGLAAWIRAATRREGRPPLVAPNKGAAPSAAVPEPHEPLKAPPSISELPVLRLADIDDPEPDQDLYDGDAYEGRSFVHTAWLLAKRTVVITGLLAGAGFAAVTWETWLPKAARLSRIVFTEIDQFSRSRDQGEARQRALQEASAQLPHLAPETIQLILAGGAIDPPDVFRRACEAADRGRSALAPAEAQELQALRQQMLEPLLPEERQRTREYERARGHRLTLPSEDRDMLELFARGARAMPPASRARLQVLSGKAIATGLLQEPPVGSRRPGAD